MKVKITFDLTAKSDPSVLRHVQLFLDQVSTLDKSTDGIVVIHQDGKDQGYYIRCSILAADAAPLLDLDARLNPGSPESYRANRDLRLQHKTYLRMREDAKLGREFSDIIVEFNPNYSPSKPLKVWGGQHRSRAIEDAAAAGSSRYHGFRVYFCLSKSQRAELALVSNTNIDVSNDLFDRQVEETEVGPQLRNWCIDVGLLKQGEDFPDQGSISEKLTVQSARTFIVNFYKGKERGQLLKPEELDKNTYEPYLCTSGPFIDQAYAKLVSPVGPNPWKDQALRQAGKAFADLHRVQYEAIRSSKSKRKSFRSKCLTDSVLSAWSYIAGLLQTHPPRLKTHLLIPKSPKGAPDPLNAAEMSKFKHDQDPQTYRGLGTRSLPKDRQRMAQVFLARSRDPGLTLDKTLLNKAVSTVVGLKVLEKGY